METDTENCFVCDKPLSIEDQSNKIRTFKERGVATIRAASERRKDRKHLKLKNVTSLTLHHTCYTTYIRESSINTAIARRSSLIAQVRRENKIKRMQEAQPSLLSSPIQKENTLCQISQPATKKRVAIAVPRDFDFKLDCFFCGGDASDEYMKKIKKYGKLHKRVSFVTKAETKEKILAVIKKSDDRNLYMKAIADRLKKVNLIEVMARYHKDCLVNLHKYKPSSNARGRPISEETINALNFIIDQIVKTPNESQYSLTSLLENYSNGDKPALNTVKDKLQTFASNELAISTICRGDCNILLIGCRNQILNNWQNYLQEIRDKQSIKK